MFISGPAQKQGFASTTIGSGKNVISTLQGTVGGSALEANVQSRSTKRKRHTIIGDTESSGLLIQGTYEVGFDKESGIDSELHDFPISYSGVGLLKFVSPVRIPSVDGDLAVTGDVAISGSLTVAGGVVPGLTAFSFVDDIEMSGDVQFDKDIAGSYAFAIVVGPLCFAQIRYKWTSINGADTTLVHLTGLPFATAIGSEIQVITSDLSTTHTGGTIIFAISDGGQVLTLGERVHHTNQGGGMGPPSVTPNIPESGILQTQIIYRIAV